ncbi:tetratricopeptide repeat protein [Psychrobacillus sp. FJAT-51614]|uniref:tetratricopeptide repeat protein n=1 Tax=Psychrobacillus mangrovi TaxID=3117745 RepID=UPI0030137B03
MYIINSSKEQDRQFVIEQEKYNVAVQDIQGGEYDQALSLLEEVDQTNTKSVPVKYYIGVAHFYKEDFDKAAQEFSNLLDINPYMVKDSEFMLLFAHTLINANQFDEASIVLERCKNLQTPENMPDYQDQVNQLIKQITVSS